MRMHASLSPLLVFAAIDGVAVSQSHPHFDDGGALHWYTSFAEAKAAAKRQDKLVFIEYGRRA